ncbi:MAG: LON peptidase substrate-binding domain-containing protein, partial [Deltaproteobacteria bacterium]|nr:LON peptidase substrate-binding domain-containing protein [Deltaproteobacteria bacterium]
MTPEEPTSEEPETEFEAQVAQGQAQIESLPPVLPVLPLRNTVLFPSLVMPMVATTERAQRLIDDALAGDRLLVAVAAKDPEIDEPGHADLYDVGTVVRILRMIKTEEGTQRLWVQGLLRVKILEYESSEPYMRARVEVLEEQEGRGLEVEALQRNVSTQFNQIAEGLSNIPEAVRALVMGLEDTSALCDVVAANLGLSVPDRQELLEMVRVRERLERVSAHLAREQEVRRLEEEIRGEVQEELSRSQREYVLREQARAIRRQLGESESPAELVDELRRRLDALTLPDEVRQQAERELDRLAALPPGAVEAGTLRTYLEWIVDLP